MRRGVGSDQDDREEVKLHLHHETDRAYKVSPSGGEEDAVWLAKSQVDCNTQRPAKGRTHEFMVPQWLLEKEGLC